MDDVKNTKKRLEKLLKKKPDKSRNSLHELVKACLPKMFVLKERGYSLKEIAEAMGSEIKLSTLASYYSCLLKKVRDDPEFLKEVENLKKIE